jgi:hypothetical protein
MNSSDRLMHFRRISARSAVTSGGQEDEVIKWKAIYIT